MPWQLQGGVFRLAFWLAAGAGALALIVHAPRDADTQAPSPAVAKRAADTRGSADDLLALLRRPPLPEEVRGEPFVMQGWTRATAPPAAAQERREATPVFPFKYAGQVQESGRQKVFLTRGDDVFPIERGAVYEGFRIDAIGEERIDITYLANGQSLSLPLSSLRAEPAAPVAVDTSPAVQEPRTESLGAAPSNVAAAPLAGVQTHAALGVPGGFGVLSPAPLAGLSVNPPMPLSGGNPPAAGSMPTAASGVPSGNLGVPPSSSGRIGTSPTSSGKLGS